MGERKRERQFGVRYGDGEVNGPMLTKIAAAEHIKNIRWHLDNDPDYSGEEDLYEPMALVSRWHVVNTSEWVEVGREGEAAARSYLDTLEGMTADPALLDAIAAVREGRPPPTRRRWWQRALTAAQPGDGGDAAAGEG